MAGSNKSTETEVIQNWLNKTKTSVSDYNFYQLVELINKMAREDGLDNNDNNESIRFKSSANIAFPTRDVVSVEQKKDGSYELEVAFLGLHGSQSPLPGYYLDALSWEEAQQSNQVTDYLNLFNHRFLTLLHRIWRKYRYYICFDEDGTDAFSRHMFSLVGLGSDTNRQMVHINHSKMLAYAGLLASPSRSPDVICSLISHCFDLDDVRLFGWKIRRVPIQPEQQNRLGEISHQVGQKSEPRSLLGENFSLGAHILDCNGKCIIEIASLPLDRFMSFLPNGKDFLPLVAFVSYIMHEQLAWDLRLKMAENQVGGMVLGEKYNNQLGWRSFLGTPESQPFVTISVLE